jgi:hypothetical protein
MKFISCVSSIESNIAIPGETGDMLCRSEHQRLYGHPGLSAARAYKTGTITDKQPGFIMGSVIFTNHRI